MKRVLNTIGIVGGALIIAVYILLSIFDDNSSAKKTDRSAISSENHPPMSVRQLAGATIAEKRETTRWIVSAFRDPDGDDLSYMAESEQPDIVTVEVSLPELIIKAVSRGATRVHVTATDPEGMSASQAFSIEVVENRPPMARGKLEDVAIETGVESRRRLVSAFRDPDGDDLSYAAKSEQPDIVTVEVSLPELIIKAASRGTTRVHVTATDPDGLSVSQVFPVEVKVAALASSPEAVVVGSIQEFFGPPNRSSFPVVVFDTTARVPVDGQIRIVLDKGNIFQAEFDVRIPTLSEVGHQSHQEYHDLAQVLLGRFVTNTVVSVDDGLSVVGGLVEIIAEDIKAGRVERDVFGETGYYVASTEVGGAKIVLKYSIAGDANPNMDYYVIYIQ